VRAAIDRRWSIHLLPAIAVALGALGPTRAAAQTEAELEQARQAFEEGVAASDAGDFETAATRFRRVMGIRSTTAVKYNLALALHELGNDGEAATLLRDVVEDRSFDRRARYNARRILRAVEPDLGELTIHVEGDEAGVGISIGDRPVTLADVGRPLSVASGDHTVALTREGRTVASETVFVDADGSAEVTLSAVPTPRQVAVQTETPPDVFDTEEVEEDDGGGSVFAQGWFWTGLGVVVAGAAVAVVLATEDEPPQPVQGDLEPGLVEVMP